MRSAIIAGQPIEFYVAMDDETTGGLTVADSNPTLSSASKNGSTFTPGGGEMVIGNVTASQGYRVTFTPATLPAVADDYQFIFNYIVGGTTYKLSYSFIAVPEDSGGGGGGGSQTEINYTVHVTPGISSGSSNCDAADRRKHNLEARKNDRKTFIIPVYESDGVTPFDLSALTLRVVIEPKGSGTDRQVIEDADITVGGDDNNVVSFTTSTCNAIAGVSETLKWALQKITTSPAGKEDILFGDYYVREGCSKD